MVIGLNDDGSLGDFPGLRTGTMNPFFQIDGIVLFSQEWLKTLVKRLRAALPRFLRW